MYEYSNVLKYMERALLNFRKNLSCFFGFLHESSVKLKYVCIN